MNMMASDTVFNLKEDNIKCIDLSKENEPDIYAIEGALSENISFSKQNSISKMTQIKTQELAILLII